MDIQKMKSFITVYECGNLSKAADLLYCSQPALSKQINTLEQELGYTLFIRNGKKLTVNENGEIFYRFAKNMINDYASLKRELFIKNNPPVHEVRFGTTNFIGTYLLPPVLGKFKDSHPSTPVSFMVNFLQSVIDLLEKDVINFAFIPQSNRILNHPEFQCEPILEDEFSLIVPVNHPLAQLEKVYSKDIENYPFLTSQENSATREFITTVLEENNIKLKTMINMYNTNTIKHSVINDLGISILSKRSFEKDEFLGLLKSIELVDLPIKRQIFIVKKRKHKLSEEEALFIKQFIQSGGNKNEL